MLKKPVINITFLILLAVITLGLSLTGAYVSGRFRSLNSEIAQITHLWEESMALDDEIQEHLRIESISHSIKLGGENPKFVFDDPSGRSWLAKFYFFKPYSLNNPQRSVAAGNLAELLGIETPIAVIFDVHISDREETDRGVAKLFYKDIVPLEKTDTSTLDKEARASLYLHNFFDHFVLNPDQSDDNYIYMAEENRILAIDKDRSFSLKGINLSLDRGMDEGYTYNNGTIGPHPNLAYLTGNPEIARRKMLGFIYYLSEIDDQIFSDFFDGNLVFPGEIKKPIINAWIKYKDMLVDKFLDPDISEGEAARHAVIYAVDVKKRLKNKIAEKKFIIKSLQEGGEAERPLDRIDVDMSVEFKKL